MDFYCTDRKLSELGEHDFDELLDADSFIPHSNANGLDHFGLENGMDQDWLENFFDDPVLNDRMISDAVQPQNVQSEHSYSLANGDGDPDSPLNLKMESSDKELDAHLLRTVNPNMTTGPLAGGGDPAVAGGGDAGDAMKEEPVDMTTSDPVDLSVGQLMTAATAATTATTLLGTVTQQTTLLRQPTVVLGVATTAAATDPMSLLQTDRVILSRVNIKLEPMDVSDAEHISAYESIGLPPTPPSSGSDSDCGGQSPDHSADCSPLHPLTYAGLSSHALLSNTISFQPIPSTGMLLLSDEEKRTLISEGYPIPGKLPLTKQEEKNLKKIRRKIKNKISAQESRRKKKEYLESLEKQVEMSNQENTDLRRQVDHLENNNRSLTSQLQKLQNLVGKVTRLSGSASAPQAGTCLMVLVLCFAVFLGSWSPMAWSGVGHHSAGPVPIVTATLDDGMPAKLAALASAASAAAAASQPGLPPGPDLKAATAADSYSTPNVRSRLLLSVKDEADDAEFGPHPPFSCRDFVSRWFSSSAEPPAASTAPEPPQPTADVPITATAAMTVASVNLTGDQQVRRPAYPAAGVAADVVSAPIQTTA